MESSKLPPPPPMSSSATSKSGPPPMNLKPGNHERGWNDPPVFPVEINAVVKSAPTKLNKRVPFPGLTSTSPTQSAFLPPPPGIQASGNVNDDSVPTTNINSLLDGGQGTNSGLRSATGILPSTSVEFIPTLPTPAPPGANTDQGYPAHEGNNNAQGSESELLGSS